MGFNTCKRSHPLWPSKVEPTRSEWSRADLKLKLTFNFNSSKKIHCLTDHHKIVWQGKKSNILTELTHLMVFVFISAEQKHGQRQPLVSWQKQSSYNCKSGCEPLSIPQSFSHNRIEQVRICSRAKSQPAARASRESLHYMEQGIIYGALLLCSGAIWQTYWLWHTWGCRYLCTYFPLWHNLIWV